MVRRLIAEYGRILLSSYIWVTYAPSVGVQFGVFEAGVKYEAIAVSGSTLSNIGVRLWCNF